MAHKMFLDDFSYHSDSFAISVQNNLYMYVNYLESDIYNYKQRCFLIIITVWHFYAKQCLFCVQNNLVFLCMKMYLSSSIILYRFKNG